MAAEADQFEEDHSTTKGNCKTDLTLTGLLMEGHDIDVSPSSYFDNTIELLYLWRFDFPNIHSNARTSALSNFGAPTMKRTRI